MQNAVLATEDAGFREHQGVSWSSVARAALANLRSGEIMSGASTITQQLVKLLTGNAAETLQRKLREAVYAIELEQSYSKDEILEIYLNEAFLGNGVYGIGTAADYYFAKPVGELTIPEAALLAGMIRSPAANDPIDHPEAAVQRRDIVIEQMVEADFIDPAQAEVYVQAPLVLNINPPPDVQEPFFVSYVRTVLREIDALGTTPEAREREVLRGGYRIETTLDPEFQRLADLAIRDVLTDVDGPQSALTAIDPRTGRIVAIGFGPKTFGTGPGQTEVLPAVPGVGSSFGRQPGSSFKAFEVVAALEAGVPPGYTIDTPSPYRPTGECPERWNPGNYSDGGGGSMDMAAATARSSNVYFAHLVDRFTGPDGLADTATRMGIVNTDLTSEPVCSAVLGSREVYPIDMASGFGTLANNGVHCEPYAITRILDRDGTPIFEIPPDTCWNQDQAIAPEIAATATGLLRGPIENGTATRNARIGRPAAGKTGTTQNYRDAWFVGFIPQLSTAVWVGNEIPSPMTDPRCGNVTGGCLPTMIWQNFMESAIAYQGYPVVDFPAAPRIRGSVVPSVVGMLQGAAERVLQDADFTPSSTPVADYRPEGTVIGQSPGGGTEAPPGSQVLLRVSDGTGVAPTVPKRGRPHPGRGHRGPGGRGHRCARGVGPRRRSGALRRGGEPDPGWRPDRADRPRDHSRLAQRRRGGHRGRPPPRPRRPHPRAHSHRHPNRRTNRDPDADGAPTDGRAAPHRGAHGRAPAGPDRAPHHRGTRADRGPHRATAKRPTLPHSRARPTNKGEDSEALPHAAGSHGARGGRGRRACVGGVRAAVVRHAARLARGAGGGGGRAAAGAVLLRPAPVSGAGASDRVPATGRCRDRAGRAGVGWGPPGERGLDRRGRRAARGDPRGPAGGCRAGGPRPVRVAADLQPVSVLRGAL